MTRGSTVRNFKGRTQEMRRGELIRRRLEKRHIEKVYREEFGKSYEFSGLRA